MNDLQKRFVEHIKLRALGDKFIDKAEEKEILSFAIRRYQEAVPRVPVADVALQYAVRLVRATRPGPEAPKAVQEWVAWGAGPRAAQHLVLGAKARALLEGRFAAGVEDVRALALPVLKHRVVPNFRAEAQGVKVGDLLNEILRATPGV